jgi:hypothetical protein
LPHTRVRGAGGSGVSTGTVTGASTTEVSIGGAVAIGGCGRGVSATSLDAVAVAPPGWTVATLGSAPVPQATPEAPMAASSSRRPSASR